VPAPGNVGEATSYTLTGLTPGVPYYWSVQAVDASFMGSAFSTEQVFALGYGADSTTFPGIEGGSVAFGDYNSDGQLDAVVTGTDSSGAALAKVYQRFLVNAALHFRRHFPFAIPQSTTGSGERTRART